MARKLVVCFLVFIALPLSGAEIVSKQNLGWYAYRDLSGTAFAERFDFLSERGFRMIDVDAYSTSQGIRYAMVWEENDGRDWAEWHNLSSSQYLERWSEYKDLGYRPTDIEAYLAGNTMRYAGIWVENRENIAWGSWRNMTSTGFANRFREMYDKGYMLVDMEAYKTPSGTRYAAIWYKNTRGIGWAQLHNMTRERYQQEVDKYSDLGYQMVDYERYTSGSQTRYAAIWHDDGGTAHVIRTDRPELQYANYFREFRDDGYRPVDFERNDDKYGAIWIKENTRIANFRHRTTINQQLKNYLDTNNLPGLSAAVYQNGRLIYRGGVGVADGGKVAHGETVYPVASVSKAIGGTLLGRLEDQGMLANGQSVTIAGSDFTRRHLPAMPAFHQHRLSQLVSHTACISHYGTTPAIENQTNHYVTQVAASASIWNRPLLDGCTIGASEEYSTHAFTFLGAAMETATGRTIPQLVREELADPFRLPSMRVLYTTSSLPPDYDRSAWYSGGNQTGRGNNSWKAFGGGIEANAIDLARFGWLSGAGRITSTEFRDNTLFASQANSTTAYAWLVNTQNGRRQASHSGSWTGARSRLAVWPDDGLSIAILSNQTGHNGLATLANEIGNLILDN